MELYIEDVKIKYNENEKFNDLNDIEIFGSDRYGLNRNYSFTPSIQGSLMLYNIGSLNLLNKLLKLPRKKKKRLGTKKARKKMLNKVKRNLPVSVKQLKRAGLTLTFPTMIKL